MTTRCSFTPSISSRSRARICGIAPAPSKNNLARLLARRSQGIFASDYEQDEIGPDLFRKACEFGLEGLVSKHRDRAYRATAQHWVKVKNPEHPAMKRVKDIFLLEDVTSLAMFSLVQAVF